MVPDMKRTKPDPTYYEDGAACFAMLAANALALAETTPHANMKKHFLSVARHWQHWHSRYLCAASLASERLEAVK